MQEEWVVPGAQVRVVTTGTSAVREVTVLTVGKRYVIVTDQRGIEEKFAADTLSKAAGQAVSRLEPVS